MELVVAGALGRSFRKGANEEAHRRVLWQLREQQDRQRRQREEQFDQSESDLIDLATAIITSEQAELFQSELNIYHEATYEALRENEERLEGIETRIEHMLSRAHVLEDGRRVFKTEDGTRVFDEFGKELDEQTIAPTDIDDNRPRWERFSGAMEERERLLQQREELLDFQSDLDGAQDLLDSGKMTQEQFEERRQYLRDHAPDAVKVHAKGIAFENNDKPTATNSAEPDINLDDELAALPAPQPTIPGMG